MKASFLTALFCLCLASAAAAAPRLVIVRTNAPGYSPDVVRKLTTGKFAGEFKVMELPAPPAPPVPAGLKAEVSGPVLRVIPDSQLQAPAQGGAWAPAAAGSGVPMGTNAVLVDTNTGTVYLIGTQYASNRLEMFRSNVQHPDPAVCTNIIGGAECYGFEQVFVYEYPGLANIFPILFFKFVNTICDPGPGGEGAGDFAPAGAAGVARTLVVEHKDGTCRLNVSEVKAGVSWLSIYGVDPRVYARRP